MHLPGVIPILQDAGHKVIAVDLPLHSAAGDVATVDGEEAGGIDLVGGPVILVAHSYGGFVITNAGYMSKALFTLLPLLLARANP